MIMDGHGLVINEMTRFDAAMHHKITLTTGTKWENQHFRTYILGTLSTMCEWLVHWYLSSNVGLLSCRPRHQSTRRLHEKRKVKREQIAETR